LNRYITESEHRIAIEKGEKGRLTSDFHLQIRVHS
jgi:hypothetical protein